MHIAVHVHPGSRHPDVGGSHDGSLRVAVRARAVDGRATSECLALVAAAFDVRPGAVTCVRGAHSRDKLLAIDGEPLRLRARLEELLRGTVAD